MKAVVVDRFGSADVMRVGKVEEPVLKPGQVKVKNLANDNPKIPSNLLRSLQNLQPSQLMDKSHWDFKGLSSETKSSVEPLLDRMDDVTA